MEKLVLGVAPIKRSFLSMEAAKEQKDIFMEVVRGIRPDAVELVTIDDVCENGIAYEYETIQKVVDKFKDARVDALFLPFCDFGEESVAAGIAAKLKVPTLVWGPRDTAPNTDACRGRDTQCGIIAATKVLSRFGVTFSYIVNSPAKSAKFQEGFETFLRASMVVKAMKGMRIAQIGNRPEPFMSVISNEGELLEKFGVQVVPIAISTIVGYTKEIAEAKSEEYLAYIKEFSGRLDYINNMSEEQVAWTCALTMAMEKAIREKDCVAAAVECWPRFEDLKGLPCIGIGELTDKGLPISCEGDISGAVTLALLNAATMGDSAQFFADLTIRHPENDNAELLWHCGPFPYSLRDTEKKAGIDLFNGRWELKKGDITICRFDSIGGEYVLFAGEGKTTDGPETTGTYVWFETENWEEWEEKLVFGPYIHHVAGAYGTYARALEEAARYLNVTYDTPGKNQIKGL